MWQQTCDSIRVCCHISRCASRQPVNALKKPVPNATRAYQTGTRLISLSPSKKNWPSRHALTAQATFAILEKEEQRSTTCAPHPGILKSNHRAWSKLSSSASNERSCLSFSVITAMSYLMTLFKKNWRHSMHQVLEVSRPLLRHNWHWQLLCKPTQESRMMKSLKQRSWIGGGGRCFHIPTGKMNR